MRNLICRKLADLASTRLQHRFINEATAQAYMLPEEVLEDAHEAIRIAKRSTDLSESDRVSIAQFTAVFESTSPNLSLPDFVDTDSEWIKLRHAAVACLEQLKFDLQQYENGVLSSHVGG